MGVVTGSIRSESSLVNGKDVTPKGFIVSKSGVGGVGLGNNVSSIVQLVQEGSILEEYCWDIFSETVLQAFRRYADYYNPTAHELLANVALANEQCSEVASTNVEKLNDVDFVSTNGSTSHESWMKLADIFTERLTSIAEGSEVDVNIEGFVQSVKQFIQEGKGSCSEFCWDVVEEFTLSNIGNGGSEMNEAVC